jgi:DNA-binding FadR family transcriptional regulator
MFEPIKKDLKISQKVAEQIKEYIYEGRLKPGTFLPPEHVLADELGISRSSLREALIILQAVGYISIIPRKGSMILPVMGSDAPEEPIKNMIREDLNKIFHLFEVRKIIDVEVAGLAAVRATDEDIKGLKDIFREIQDYIRQDGTSILDPKPSALYVKTFRRISEASKNPICIHLTRNFWALFDDIYPEEMQRRLSSLPRISRTFFNQYRKIIEAIEAHDASKARRAALLHLEFIEQKLKEIIIKNRMPADLGKKTALKLPGAVSQSVPR